MNNKRKYLIISFIAVTTAAAAQNVGIGTPMPTEKLEVNGKTKTGNFQMTSGAASGHLLQSDVNGNASWVAPAFGGGHGGGFIPFSTGVILNGATVVSSAPVLMGFGSNDVEVIDGTGESTLPPQAGGFAFTIPFSGTIQNLQISTDLLVASVVSINVTPLTYHFQVFRSSSVPNDGTGHISSPYVTTTLTSSVTIGGFGNPVTAGTFYSATNINLGSLAVNAGDRIGVRIRTDPSSSRHCRYYSGVIQCKFVLYLLVIAKCKSKFQLHIKP